MTTKWENVFFLLMALRGCRNDHKISINADKGVKPYRRGFSLTGFLPERLKEKRGYERRKEKTARKIYREICKRPDKLKTGGVVGGRVSITGAGSDLTSGGTRVYETTTVNLAATEHGVGLARFFSARPVTVADPVAGGGLFARSVNLRKAQCEVGRRNGGAFLGVAQK